jgi:hypothetical protein
MSGLGRLPLVAPIEATPPRLKVKGDSVMDLDDLVLRDNANIETPIQAGFCRETSDVIGLRRESSTGWRRRNRHRRPREATVADAAARCEHASCQNDG